MTALLLLLLPSPDQLACMQMTLLSKQQSLNQDCKGQSVGRKKMKNSVVCRDEQDGTGFQGLTSRQLPIISQFLTPYVCLETK